MWLSHDGRVFWERGRRTRQYFGRHGIYISIGCRLSLLDMGSCARIRRLGAILGRGTGTSTVRVTVGLGLGLGLGFRAARVDAHVNILGGTAYMLVLDVDYHC